MTVEIKLTKGLVAVVDGDDADLALFNWYAATPRGRPYAQRTAWPRESVILHRVVAGRFLAISGQCVDHIDGDTLNNRRSNLRVASDAQNLRNRGKNKSNTSGFKGSFFRKDTGRWFAQIMVNRRSINLGCHSTAEAAARAYDAAALKYFGEFAKLNFPPVNGDLTITNDSTDMR